MAVLAHTELSKKLPLGTASIKTFRVQTPAADQAADWIATGFGTIVGLISCSVTTTAGAQAAAIPVFVLNARGTGVAENTNHGDLGIETRSAAGIVTVTVLGR